MLPALVIGIGGTGKWAILDLKRRIERVNGEIPKNLRLIAFDVSEEEAIPVERYDFDLKTGEMFSEKLKRGPHLEIFGLERLKNISLNIDKYPTIKKWLSEEDVNFLKKETSEESHTGAGKIRAEGRISFFIHINKIKNKLNDLLTSLGPQAEQQYPLLVIFISSIAGGTGCGTFLDFAILTRSLLKKRYPSLSSYFYGIFSLPKTFSSIKPDEFENDLMQANCFAAWRELHRFQTNPNYKIQYEPNDQSEIEEMPFTWVYFVDGEKLKTYSTEEPKPFEGTNPSISDFVFFLLQGHYAPHERNLHSALTTNLEPNWDSQIYGTFGTHRWVIDLKEFQESLGLKYFLKTLDHLLLEVPPGEGYKLAQNFFKDARNTPFFKEVVYSIRESGSTPQDNPKNLFKKIAGGVGNKDLNLPTLNFTDIKLPLTANFFYRLLSRKVFDDLKQVANDRFKKWIGAQNDSLDPARPKETSTFGALNFCKTKQIEAFNEFIREFSLGILNHSEKGLNFYIAFLEEVKNIIVNSIEKLRDVFDGYGIPTKKEKLSEVLVKSEKRKNIKAYFTGLKKLFEYEQVSIISKYYLELLSEIQKEVENLLAQGNKQNSFLVDIRTEIEKFMANLKSVRAGFRRVRCHSYVTQPDDLYEQKFFNFAFGFDEPKREIEKTILQRIGKKEFRIFWENFKWTFEKDIGLILNPPSGFPSLSFQTETEESVRKVVYDFTNKLLENDQYFPSLSNLNIFDFLQFCEKSIDNFVVDLWDKSNYLANYDPVRASSTEIHLSQVGTGQDKIQTDKSYLVISETAIGNDFYQKLVEKEAFKNLNFENIPVQGQNTEIWACRISYFWNSNGFSHLRVDTENIYRDFLNKSKVPVHIFPEERVASKILERKIGEIFKIKNYLLSPALIPYLGDYDFLKAFLYAYIFKFFQPDASSHDYKCQVEDPLSKTIKEYTLGKKLTEVLKKSKEEENICLCFKDFWKNVKKENITRDFQSFLQNLRNKYQEINDEIENEESAYSLDEKELLRLMAALLAEEIEEFEKFERRKLG